MLVDNYGRSMDYLRIAVTDRCNLRCSYCMPKQGINFLAKNELLSFEEILRLGRIFSELGVKKIRLTGGEPFVRKEIISLITDLSALFKSLHITTNATLLHKHFETLKNVGRQNLNISIDSLDRNRFFAITHRDDFDQVWANILKAIKLDFRVKLNVVIMKGVNHMEILDFVKLVFKYPISVRFIESMPFNAHQSTKNYFMSAKNIKDIIQKAYPSLRYFVSDKNSASDHYDLDRAQGNIGIIPAFTRSLCGQCNRIRLTSKGELLTCLYAEKGLDLKTLMRTGYLDNELKEIIRTTIYYKKKDGFEEEKLRNPGHPFFQSMTTIGG